MKYFRTRVTVLCIVAELNTEKGKSDRDKQWGQHLIFASGLCSRLIGPHFAEIQIAVQMKLYMCKIWNFKNCIKEFCFIRSYGYLWHQVGSVFWIVQQDILTLRESNCIVGSGGWQWGRLWLWSPDSCFVGLLSALEAGIGPGTHLHSVDCEEKGSEWVRVTVWNFIFNWRVFFSCRFEIGLKPWTRATAPPPALLIWNNREREDCVRVCLLFVFILFWTIRRVLGWAWF